MSLNKDTFGKTPSANIKLSPFKAQADGKSAMDYSVALIFLNELREIWGINAEAATDQIRVMAVTAKKSVT